MSGNALPLAAGGPGRRRSTRAPGSVGISSWPDVVRASLAMIFLLPLGYMVLTSAKDSTR